MRHLAAKNYFKAFALVLISARLILSSTEHGCPSLISRNIRFDSSLWMQTMRLLDQKSIRKVVQRDEVNKLITKLGELKNFTLILGNEYAEEVFNRTFEEHVRYHSDKSPFQWLLPADFNISGSETDLSEVLRAGYDTFQRVTNALEFSKLNLERDCEMYLNRAGRYWKRASQASNDVVKNFYISLKIDPYYGYRHLPIITRNSIPSNMQFELNLNGYAQSRIDDRDFFIIRDTLSNIDHFFRGLYLPYYLRWPQHTRTNRASNLNRI